MRSDLSSAARRLLTLAVFPLIAACAATQQPAPKSTYLLEAVRTAGATPAAHPGSLSVALFRVAEPFAGKGMVYRFDEYRYESDFYHQYFVAPRDMITERVFEWLQSAGVFQSVRLATGVRRRGGLTLEGLVTQMYCDLRSAQRPAAVLAIQFYVVGDRGQVLFATQLRSVNAMADSSAESASRSLSEALVAVLTELETQLRIAPLDGISHADSSP
jgi:cholesterol transport system auxiliary component